MELRYETQIFRSDPKMCKIIPRMNNVMDIQPVKNRKDLKPLDISNTAQETNEESTIELGVCIVLGLFIGMMDGMDDVIKCISV